MAWIIEGWNIIWHALATAAIMLAAILIIVKINGLRSFAKVTPIDLVVTVTIGSVINSTILTDSNSIVKGVLVITMLMFLQAMFGRLKHKFKWFDTVLYNDPVMVVENGKFLEENMKKLNLTDDIILSKLREKNIMNMAEVRAMIMETTGDFSVLSGNTFPDNILLKNVVRQL